MPPKNLSIPSVEEVRRQLLSKRQYANRALDQLHGPRRITVVDDGERVVTTYEPRES